MATSTDPSTTHVSPLRHSPPTKFVTAVGALAAVWCLGFAAVSIWFEATAHFATGPTAEFATGLSVVNWSVAVAKLIGAAVAVLAILPTPRLVPPRIVSTLLWAGLATLGLYVTGSLIQAVGMLTGLMGDPELIDAAALLYVGAFLFAAVSFGILAVTYARRMQTGKLEIFAGAVAGPLLLLAILIILPTLLRLAGVNLPE